MTLGQAFEVAYQLALVSQTQRENRGHVRSKSATQLSTKSTGRLQTGRDKNQSFSGNEQSHSRSYSVADIPVPVISAKSASSSPNTSTRKIPRSDSFSCSSHGLQLTRAPIVTKEEL